MAKPINIEKFNENNTLINKKNIFVPTAPVSADGKVINTKTNLLSQDSSKSIDDFEFYFPEYLNSATPDLSKLKSKVENNIFNEDILSSNNAFRLILIWLFTHVYPKMTQLADNNLKLSSEGAVEALKNFTQLSLISLATIKNAYEKEISAANCQLASSIVDFAGSAAQLGLGVRNQIKNGDHQIAPEKLKMQKALKDNIKNELTKYEAEGDARLNLYGSESDYTRTRNRVNGEVANDQQIFRRLGNINRDQVAALDNSDYLKHLDVVHKEVTNVLNNEGMIHSKSNLFIEVNPNSLNDEVLVRRTAILERSLRQYDHSLNDDDAYNIRSTKLNKYFLTKKRALEVGELYAQGVGSAVKMIGAISKQQGDFRAADSKRINEGNTVFMQVYGQEMQNKFAQIDGLINVCKEAFDLLAKYLENYFNAANASNLQR
ncbi:MAG TPA: hypothetical protein PKD00_09790 [Burkholderiales bacterium]|nr:hypothetical protein [Burkholderiales bacterium]